MTVPTRFAAWCRAIPELLVRHRRRVWLAWVLAIVALAPRAATVEERLDVAARVETSESARVEALLARRFESPFARWVVLVATGLPSPHDSAGAAVLEQITSVVGNVHGVTQTLSWLDLPDTLLLGEAVSGERGTFVIVGLDRDLDRPDALIPILRDATSELEAALREQHADVRLMWTGELALKVDLRRASASDAERAERRLLPLTLVLLVIAFGAVVAAILPVASGALAITLALGAAVVIDRWWPMSILLQNVVSMLGLGLGIDYALLMVSRFREARATGLDSQAAAVEAGRRAGRTIALSGSTVAIGFGALLIVPLNELRAIAVGGMLVTLFSVLLATTLLPGVLAALGPRVDGLRVMRLRQPVPDHGAWRTWARWVVAHPLFVLALGGLLILPLAWQSARISTDLPRGDWLPREMESAEALRVLQGMRRGGMLQTLRVIVELPSPTTVESLDGWNAAVAIAEHLERDARVARVRSLPSVSGIPTPHPLLLAMIPSAVRQSFATADGSVMLIEVIPHEHVGPAEMAALVHALRAYDPATLTGLVGTSVLVGGLPAFNVDFEQAIAGWLPMVVGLVVGATYLVLLLAFRSVLIALKAVALNLASVGAAVGAMVLVFQDGHGAELLGVSGATGGVFPVVPILVFCTVFGLSMDYEIFLIARVREARLAGAAEADAITTGVERSGRLITSAAAIMVVVFGAFTLGDFLLIQMLGFTLAVAVLLDATVIRLAVGPALLRLAGRWNWWPGDARRSEVPWRGRRRRHATDAARGATALPRRHPARGS